MDGTVGPGSVFALKKPQPDTGAGMPAEKPGIMPSQDLHTFDSRQRRKAIHPWRRSSSVLVRLFVLSGTVALAAFATNEMRLALNVGGLTLLEIAVLVLFAIDILWIALPCVTCMVGLPRLLWRRVWRPPEIPTPLASRTAILMPTYNEEPARIAAALDAMARSLVALNEEHSFDMFILSDTNDGDVALAEEEVLWGLRQRLGPAVPVYYRRRIRNLAHKSGNVREFCERWGHAYDHLLMLDADSLLDGATLVRLVRRMESDPDAGLIQTVPRLHNATTLVARLQQFAGAVYGPVLSAGLAWWTGKDGNFWGHNAILRTRAFMEAAGLPELSGKPPLGGSILSHDFVEAALMRRAGWNIVIADDLDGSYEECPGSIIDMEARDRRWCQGNLQHLRVLTGRGLRWVSRLHFISGIFSYVSSPVWLLFLVFALGLGVQNEFARPEYFNSSYSLFPLWPHVDPVRALRLFGITLAILLGPKVIGLLSFILTGKRMRVFGWLMLPFSVVWELLVSGLIAPILMLVHCGLVFDVLLGRDAGWRPQRRTDDSLPWSQVLRRHRWHMVIGVVLALAALSVSWEMLAWLLPAVIGMVLAVPLSQVTASPAVGQFLRRLGLFRVPEEVEPTAIWQSMTGVYPFYRDLVAAATPSMLALVGNPELVNRHAALVDHSPDYPAGPLDATQGMALLKIQSARSVEDAVAHLSAQERARVLSVPSLMAQLCGLQRRGQG
jgi:membrane glycosyltransferase